MLDFRCGEPNLGTPKDLIHCLSDPTAWFRFCFGCYLPLFAAIRRYSLLFAAIRRCSPLFADIRRYSLLFCRKILISGNSAKKTHVFRKAASFLQNSQQWYHFCENVLNLYVFLLTFSEFVCFSLKFNEFLVEIRWIIENIQILPMGNVRHFRRILKNDAPFLKTCVFFAEFTEISIFRQNNDE